DCVICVMATGIVVRSIAPMIVDKTVDPAVIVIDEKAYHIISLLSGHIGGANQWTRQIGHLLNSDSVITTATDTENVQSLDMLAKSVEGWYPNFKENTKKFNGLLAEKKRVYLYIEDYLIPYVNNFRGFTRIKKLEQLQSADPLVVVSDRLIIKKRDQTVQIFPRVNILGIGCRKNINNKMIQEAFIAFCQHHNLAWLSFKALASIDIKQNEGALQYLSKMLNIPIKFYSAEQLNTVSQYYPTSKFVLQTVGVGNVACS
ncbi:cobalamin biosynthesis protein CbiG, partial [Lactobacillus sp. XV13L]|nr:cobalamin biosynthesis protein CbiG [Lactobacillus sp. XV13L]